MAGIILAWVLAYLCIGLFITGVMISGYGGVKKFIATLEVNAEIRSFIGGSRHRRSFFTKALISVLVVAWPGLLYNIIKNK
jgi:hypothetical protein